MLLLFKQGGWVMYPILAFSVVAFAVILERAVFYLLSRASSVRTVEELTAFYKEKNTGIGKLLPGVSRKKENTLIYPPSLPPALIPLAKRRNLSKNVFLPRQKR